MRPVALSEIMTRAVVTVAPDCPLAQALAIMGERRISCLVVAEGRLPVGILTERDIVRLLRSQAGADAPPTIGQVMSSPLRTVPADATLLEAVDALKDAQVRHLVVLDGDGRAVGVVGEHEIVKGLESEYVAHLEGIIAEKNAALAALAEAHAALQATEREARFAMIVTERMADATVWLSPEGRHLYTNRAWSDLSGFSAEETREKYVWDFTPNFPREDWLAHWQALRIQGALTFEAILVNKDGAPIPCEVAANHIVFDGTEYNVGIIRDLRGRRKLEADLREREERLRLVLEATTDGIWDWDLVADRVLLNHRYYELLGYAPGEFEPSSTSLPRIVHPEDLPGVLAGLDACARGGVADYDNEIRMVTKAGEVKWVHVRGRIVERDAAGQGCRMVGTITDITARKALERGIREREAFYRAAIETTGDGFWLCDRDGTILDVNSAYARMSGYAVEELRGKHISDLDAEESPAETQARLRDILTVGDATFERRHRRKDGSLWDVEVSALVSDVEGGRCFAFLRDLAARRRAETLLKARLHLSEIGRAGDIDALMTEVLDTAERLTASTIGFFHFVDDDQDSLTLQAWSTNTLANMCRAEAKGQHYAVAEAGVWADCLRQGRPVICNDYAAQPARRGLPEGHAAVTRLLSVPVPGETGFQAVIGVGNKSADYDAEDLAVVAELAGIAMDIVNWVRAETRLRESEFFLRETQRVGKLGGWKVNPEAGTLTWTDEVYAMVEEPLAFRPALETGINYYLPQYREPLRRTFEEAFAERRPFAMELELLSRTGRHRWVELRGAPNVTEGRPDYLIGTVQDISERKEAEARLLRTIDELTRSNTELERFAYVASHDLQEPLRNVVAFCQLLERQMGARLGAEERESLDIIVGGARRMRDLVRDLLEYSRAGQFEDEREPVKLSDLVAAAAANLQGAIAESGSIVECDGDVVMAVVELPMMQVVQNLISNAVKFRHPERKLRVRVHGERTPAGIEIAVADNGMGIDPAYLDQVFVIFKRLHRPSDIPGTGLGLAICRRIVENHGGRIWAESEGPGKGTTIRLVLPAAR
ncbi:PAS domain S-box protein [Magnetospirillum sp. UT-4]|uniref:PAS domain S-box protein n=1 Tax=Magnetospirillum sp. UT-4 TaxID=2681467 RepID=UPI00137C8163|nr:PAS domain S-box protein [Magnetospirillum sp. UT-4]CAA7622657.1 putative Histidine kinase [Magnetospirillum sp. UT-4]